MRTDTNRMRNYFRTRPTLQDAGLSEALYRVGALAAQDLGRQSPDAPDTDAGEPAGCQVVDEHPSAAITLALPARPTARKVRMP
jgi:hypothetical protein